MKVYSINNEKFKSIYISYNFTLEVKNKNIYSYYAVLASLMAKSSKNYTTQKAIEKYLNSLYGSIFDVNVEKIGDLYNLEFRVEFINKKFLPNNEELSEKILSFLEEIIYNPYDWTEENLEREKTFIIERINERKDDKLKYGIQKAEELICKDEPFGTYLYGESEVVEKISLDDIKKAYKDLVNSCVTIIVSGNMNGYDKLINNIENKFGKHITSEKNVEELVYNTKLNNNNEYEEVKEFQDTTQSVLALGLKINDVSIDDFYALNLYNAILGTTPSSKLFQNVREKESLAYTVRSRYYRFKDILVIYAGINKENYQKTLDVINEQLEDMKSGKITEIEFRSAKDSLLSDLLEWKDSKVAMEKMVYSNLIAFKDSNITIENMREKINNVTMKDVIDVAKKVELKKVFLLGGEENA